MSKKWNDYAKFFAAMGWAGVTSALTMWGPDTTAGKFLVVASAMLGAVSVYAVRNGEKPNAV